MSRRLDISKGINPVPMSYDLVSNQYSCWVDGRSYSFDGAEMPFTLTDKHCADRELILKHATKGGHSNG